MNQSAQSMQGVAAAAAIAQEKVTLRVEFAVTGDQETDFIAGIMAIFNSEMHASHEEDYTPSFSAIRHRTAQRVCEYLGRRFASQAEEFEKKAAGELTERIAQQRRYEAMNIAKEEARRRMLAVPPEYTTSSGTLPPIDKPSRYEVDARTEARRLQAEIIRQAMSGGSGTHSPSTNCPDSGGGSAGAGEDLRSLFEESAATKFEPEPPVSSLVLEPKSAFNKAAPPASSEDLGQH